MVLLALSLGASLIFASITDVEMPDDVDTDASLRIEPNGTYHFSENIGTSTLYWENNLPENLPVQEASLEAKLFLPSSTKLAVSENVCVKFSQEALDWMANTEININGTKTSIENLMEVMDSDLLELYLSDFEGDNLSKIVEALGLGKYSGFLNEELLAFTVEDVVITEFSWSEPRLCLGFSLEVSDAALDSDKLRDWFPIVVENFRFESYNDSFNLSMSATSDSGASVNMKASMDNFRGGNASITAEGDLPRLSDNDERVILDWSYVPVNYIPVPSIIRDSIPSIREKLEDYDVTASFTTFRYAVVSDLPENYDYYEGVCDNTWVWENENAVSALSALAMKDRNPIVRFSVTEVDTSPATEVTSTSANLNSTIHFGDFGNIDIRFKYREKGGSSWTATAWENGYTQGSYSHKITGLSPSTDYEFVPEIRFGCWRDNGSVASFTTSPPANFVVSDLRIEPKEVERGETVNISVTVKNTGGMSGTYTANLRINNSLEGKKKVTLDPGDSKTVSFKVSRSFPGTYDVELGGLTGSFRVLGPAKFIVSDLKISPKAPTAGGRVTISAIVKNIGGVRGTHTVVCTVGGRNVGSETIELGPGDWTRVEFTVGNLISGMSYDVELNGLSGQFRVASVGGPRREPAEKPTAPSGLVLVSLVLSIAVIAFVIALLYSERR